MVFGPYSVASGHHLTPSALSLLNPRLLGCPLLLSHLWPHTGLLPSLGNFFSFSSSKGGLTSLDSASFCLLVLPPGTYISYDRFPICPLRDEPVPNPRLSFIRATSLSTVSQLSECKASPKLSHSAPRHRPHPLPWETGTLVPISLPLNIPQPTHQESPWLRTGQSPPTSHIPMGTTWS